MQGIQRLALLAAAVLTLGGGHAMAAAEFFPESSTDALYEEDIDDLDCYGLWHARNEIYARHGFRFTGAREIKEFGAGTNATVTLNPVEEANVQLLESAANKNGCG